MAVKPTDKSLSQLKAQEKNLEGLITKYHGAPRLVKAETVTEQQIRAKGGSPHVNDSKVKLGAIQRRLQKGYKKSGR